MSIAPPFRPCVIYIYSGGWPVSRLTFTLASRPTGHVFAHHLSASMTTINHLLYKIDAVWFFYIFPISLSTLTSLGGEGKQNFSRDRRQTTTITTTTKRTGGKDPGRLSVSFLADLLVGHKKKERRRWMLPEDNWVNVCYNKMVAVVAHLLLLTRTGRTGADGPRPVVHTKVSVLAPLANQKRTWMNISCDGKTNSRQVRCLRGALFPGQTCHPLCAWQLPLRLIF